MKYYLFLTAALLAIFFFGCSRSSSSDLNNIDDPDKAFALALKNFNNKDYVDAIEDFSLMKVKFSGTNVSDKVQYYLGLSYQMQEEYILAAYEFEYLLKNYTTSSLAVEGRYRLALCYYGMSPKYSLDQTYTYQAITELKNFLELYPADKNAPEAEKKIRELRNKLALKELKSAELYNTMEDYRAATIYYENVVSEYFDTDWADDALYGKLQTLITRKKTAEAKVEVERFETRFPKSDLLPKVKIIKSTLPK